ncbi:hypothetical protein COV16_02020 [Candidatus Woesearchaeota archaeon CG10_big_fil_rev_8_21_14_0_10_34_8]|nr:MAG: hypothetical protein COV16_02020 [Candidatus Woesearchaeota archaeon CG10_big_fil_rev_8_21_14_0_10_34_8]
MTTITLGSNKVNIMNNGLVSRLGNFRLEGMDMPYSSFGPQLYNLCLSEGFTREQIIPSRAFCSDENEINAAKIGNHGKGN